MSPYHVLTLALSYQCHLTHKFARRFFHQLPGIESVEQIDISRHATQHGKRELAPFQRDFGRYLIRIHAIAQRQFVLLFLTIKK